VAASPAANLRGIVVICFRLSRVRLLIFTIFVPRNDGGTNSSR